MKSRGLRKKNGEKAKKFDKKAGERYNREETQAYRSGHNEAVLKICSREFLQMLTMPCYADVFAFR